MLHSLKSASHHYVLEFSPRSQADHAAGDEREFGESHATKPTPGMTTGAESFELYLPSGLDTTHRSSCDIVLIKLEIQFRLATLETILNKLRRLLRVKARVLKQKKSHVVGQKASTRAFKVVKEYAEKISAAADRYRSVRSRLIRLDDGAWKQVFIDLKQDQWQQRYRVLKEEDVRPPHWDADSDTEGALANKKKKETERQRRKKVLGEGSREASWIWRIACNDGLEDESGFDRTGMLLELMSITVG
jgi:hypothetical protein